MSKGAPFKYPKWKLSSQMDSGAFVKLITYTFLKKKHKIPDFHNSEFLMKLLLKMFLLNVIKQR